MDHPPTYANEGAGPRKGPHILRGRGPVSSGLEIQESSSGSSVTCGCWELGRPWRPGHACPTLRLSLRLALICILCYSQTGIISACRVFFLLFFKYIFTYLFIRLLWVLGAVRRIQFPEHGLNSGPLHWKPRVVATGPPGNFFKKRTPQAVCLSLP